MQTVGETIHLNNTSAVVEFEIKMNSRPLFRRSHTVNNFNSTVLDKSAHRLPTQQNFTQRDGHLPYDNTETLGRNLMSLNSNKGKESDRHIQLSLGKSFPHDKSSKIDSRSNRTSPGTDNLGRRGVPRFSDLQRTDSTYRLWQGTNIISAQEIITSYGSVKPRPRAMSLPGSLTTSQPVEDSVEDNVDKPHTPPLGYLVGVNPSVTTDSKSEQQTPSNIGDYMIHAQKYSFSSESVKDNACTVDGKCYDMSHKDHNTPCDKSQFEKWCECIDGCNGSCTYRKSRESEKSVKNDEPHGKGWGNVDDRKKLKENDEENRKIVGNDIESVPNTICDESSITLYAIPSSLLGGIELNNQLSDGFDSCLTAAPPSGTLSLWELELTDRLIQYLRTLGAHELCRADFDTLGLEDVDFEALNHKIADCFVLHFIYCIFFFFFFFFEKTSSRL